MLTILLAMGMGWLLGLIGLDTLLANAVGIEGTWYYAVFFAMGFVIWVRNVFLGGSK